MPSGRPADCRCTDRRRKPGTVWQPYLQAWRKTLRSDVSRICAKVRVALRLDALILF
jgi:hypothetical protein